jgi:hypothetical protein
MSKSPKHEQDTTISEKGPAVEGSVGSRDTQSSEDPSEEPQHHLHAKTFLAIFSVCLIYFAQDFALVGAGAVCSLFSSNPCHLHFSLSDANKSFY